MKALGFQKNIGGTSDFMKIIMKYNIGCSKLSSNGTFFYNSWFSRVKTAEEANAKRVGFCRPVKTSHKGFYLATLKN